MVKSLRLLCADVFIDWNRVSGKRCAPSSSCPIRMCLLSIVVVGFKAIFFSFFTLKSSQKLLKYLWFNEFYCFPKKGPFSQRTYHDYILHYCRAVTALFGTGSWAL